MEHAKGITAFTNPLVNSYKRLVPGFEAPIYIAWSGANRSPLIRIPAARGNGTRVELRSPDPSCNPYLAIAAALFAGLDGIKRKLTPKNSVDSNIYSLSEDERNELEIESLPSSLIDAIRELRADKYIRESVGEEVYKKYSRAKRNEWNTYNKRVSQWEIDEYLGRY